MQNKIIKGTNALPISTEEPRSFIFMFCGSFFMTMVLVVFVVMSALTGRPVHWAIIVAWLVLLCGVPLALGLDSLRRYRLARELERDYDLVEGIVKHLEIESGSGGEVPGPDLYWVHFAYDIDRIARQTTHPLLYEKLKVGDKIWVRVLRRERRYCRAELG